MNTECALVCHCISHNIHRVVSMSNLVWSTLPRCFEHAQASIANASGSRQSVRFTFEGNGVIFSVACAAVGAEQQGQWSATVTSRMGRYQTGFALQKGARETPVAPVHLEFYHVNSESFEDLMFHVNTDEFDVLAIPVAPLAPHIRGTVSPRLLRTPADAMGLICDPCMHTMPVLSVDAEAWDSEGQCLKLLDAVECIPRAILASFSTHFVIASVQKHDV